MLLIFMIVFVSLKILKALDEKDIYISWFKGVRRCPDLCPWDLNAHNDVNRQLCRKYIFFLCLIYFYL